jgi:hypothetical protein
MARQDAAHQHGNAANHFVLPRANGDFTSCFNGVLSIKKSGDLGDQISCLMIFCYQICGDIMDK